MLFHSALQLMHRVLAIVVDQKAKTFNLALTEATAFYYLLNYEKGNIKGCVTKKGETFNFSFIPPFRQYDVSRSI